MRKYVIGILIGFCLSFAVGANAEVLNMIGKTIEGAFPVKLDGRLLDNQAIVVEGTSYLPVRAIGEATGYDVKFDADLGISLTKTVTDSTYADPVPLEPTPTPTPPEMTPEEKAKKLQGLDALINEYKLRMEVNLTHSYDPNSEQIQAITQKIKDKIADLEKQKAELTK